MVDPVVVVVLAPSEGLALVQSEVPVEPEDHHQLLVHVWFTLLVVVVPVARAEQVEVLSVVMVQAALAITAYLAQ
jgi:hypothetical protein